MGVGVVFLEPDALGPIDLQLLVELLDGTDGQACVPDCVALDLVGVGFVQSGRLERMSFLIPSQDALGAPSAVRSSMVLL